MSKFCNTINPCTHFNIALQFPVILYMTTIHRTTVRVQKQKHCAFLWEDGIFRTVMGGLSFSKDGYFLLNVSCF